ncbi:hypothetical protein [Microbacterium sp. EST19A]|uniref:hypothetical protein n=1 Tax=Microbacterium sp. EST19A TaxID=2862681 RepID=UPI001CBD729C|nr:hypothetical protein [Microbacterium sp. EST19A]
MDSSFVEVSSPAWAFWRAFLDTCVGLVVGTLYAFLAILVMGIVGEDALSSLYREIDLDPVFRASMGAILAAGAILAIGVPLVMIAERSAAFRAAEAVALSRPDGVPQRQLRLELSKPPSAHLQTFGLVLFWCVAGLGFLLALGLLFDEDLREDVEFWIALAVMAAVALLAELVRRAGRRGVARTQERVSAQQSRWERLASMADAADARRRAASIEMETPRWLTTPSAKTVGRIANILLAATFVALAAFMLSVFLRQQCRTCDPVTWAEPVENGIDVLSLASGIAIAACAAAGVVAWLSGVALQFGREIALARWAAQGARRVSPIVVLPLITRNRAVVRLQRGLAAVGAALVILGTGVTWAESRLLDADVVLWAGGILIVSGFVLGWTDAARSSRERQAIRDATFPGDGTQDPPSRRESRRSATGRRR